MELMDSPNSEVHRSRDVQELAQSREEMCPACIHVIRFLLTFEDFLGWV